MVERKANRSHPERLFAFAGRALSRVMVQIGLARAQDRSGALVHRWRKVVGFGARSYLGGRLA
jgi:hypothetical protein